MKPSYHLVPHSRRKDSKWYLTVYDLPKGLDGSKCEPVTAVYPTEADALRGLAEILSNSVWHVTLLQSQLRGAVHTIMELLPKKDDDDGNQ